MSSDYLEKYNELYQDLKNLFALESVIETKIEDKVNEIEEFIEKPVLEAST